MMTGCRRCYDFLGYGYLKIVVKHVGAGIYRYTPSISNTGCVPMNRGDHVIHFLVTEQ